MQAPNISGNYPLAGPRVGPAWETLWGALSDRRWHRAIDLVLLPTPVRPVTLRQLLRAATRAGLLEVRIEGQVGAQRASYRIKEV